ncbi:MULTISPECIES: DUF3565 domain-containing protein [unclassified Pseudomonas]|uniref:DUF3565 domain-containing protein n=1 Tax=unclassified Pseudomonas TaxID=196821 RepID=UPI000D3C8F31|nr:MULTISPECIES: DUF3565 domain-containing protein [unclassified Pseudomonas]RAU43714.1 DUF3565 domain-containing protein [Pseudomonas sp. RIT 409]RAU54445.1 DUF3565 domain-containing protein [Pseudomonas sp. RIT 412]
METALLAAIGMGKTFCKKRDERPSLTKPSRESERNSDGRPRLRDPAFPINDTTVTGFRQDQDGHWIAELSCGHTQHLRHQPPWQSRAWVLDSKQRQEKIGQPFHCGWCAQGADDDNLAPQAPYEKS